MKTSRLEADTKKFWEAALERGIISGLRCQVPHTLYAAPGWSGCSCQFAAPPPGAERVRCVIVDFEITDYKGGTLEIDAKAYLHPGSGQAVGYKLFAAVHDRPVLLWGPF